METAAGIAVSALLAQVDPRNFAWVEDASIVLIVVVAVAVLLYAFYNRTIVWGSTCETLVENERTQKEAAVAEKNEAERTVIRIADDFSGHLRAVLEIKSRDS